MTQLYILAAEYSAAAAKLADLDIDSQTLADTLESLSGDFEAKIEATVFCAKNLATLADNIAGAMQNMANRRDALERRITSINAYALSCMQSAGRDKIETAHLRISVRTNPPKVEISDASAVPAEFMRTPPAPAPQIDKAAIARELKSGAAVPGCALVQTRRLEIT